MDTAQCITRITTPNSSGSGYLIAPRLVLTSAHLVPDLGGRVRVHTATDHQPRTGHVVWRGTPKGHDDAALVHVTDPGWAERAVTTRWGRLVTTTPRTSCEVWGFPELVQRTGRAAETAQLVGTVAPGNHFVNHRHVMDLSAHPPRWHAHEVRQQEQDGQRRSLWAGLSGAAMRCGNGQLLVGVVAADLEHRDHAALETVPAYVLHHDPRFRAVLAEHGVSLVLEPVELAHLAHSPRAHHRPSPAALLEAHRQVVAFHGRDQVMDTLNQWCDDDETLSAMVVHGPGGQGKTRLAHELTTRLTRPDRQGRRWATVWLKENTTAEELGPVKDTTAPLLVVVDYAETRTAQLIRLLQLCDRPPGSPPVRLLLLVRTMGEWWEQVNTATGHLLADLARQLPLPPLVPRNTERAREYHTALDHLASALPTAHTPHQADWGQVAAGLADPDLSGPEWGTVLSVHMRALADLLDATQPAMTITRDSAVEGRVLAHEYRYWDQAAATHGLDDADLTQPLRDALALAFTLTPANLEEADRLLRTAAVLKGQTTARMHQIRRWISGLYPTDGAGVWGCLQPDRLLEYFLGQRLQADPDLFDPHLHTITASDAERLVTLYTRAATHPALPTVRERLTRLCARHPLTLGPATITVATQSEDPSPLVEALDQITAHLNTDTRALERLQDSLPIFSNCLAEWAVRLNNQLVKKYRTKEELNPNEPLPHLARSLNNLSIRLIDLGKNESALQAASEAVEHYRYLSQKDSNSHLPNLTLSLNNQSKILGKMGKHQQALDTITQAVSHYRTLADRHPRTHLPDLAMSLNNQSVAMSDMGHHEEALEAITQAVEIRRKLAHHNPDAYLNDLATSLNNQANRLAALRRFEQALEAITQAVEIRRKLAHHNPDAYLNDLATSLSNQANRLAEVGRHKDAVETIAQSVYHYEELCTKNIDTHLPNLATSLKNQAFHLKSLGHYREALSCMERAALIQQRLAVDQQAIYKPHLKQTLEACAWLQKMIDHE
ncbi:tetratricopeptide repeat protein [Nocardiopsis sp. NPDC007018]|uniref:tetratricopeptide repeat protein n=1 Tax=Nocardiopsis sp. NPDC007018 TaxID=3155721 RepID=UPI0033C8EE25